MYRIQDRMSQPWFSTLIVFHVGQVFVVRCSNSISALTIVPSGYWSGHLMVLWITPEVLNSSKYFSNFLKTSYRDELFCSELMIHLFLLPMSITRFCETSREIFRLATTKNPANFNFLNNVAIKCEMLFLHFDFCSGVTCLCEKF